MSRENFEKTYWKYIANCSASKILSLTKGGSIPAHYVYDIDTDEFLFISDNINSVLGFTPTDFRSMGMKDFIDRINTNDLLRMNHKADSNDNNQDLLQKISYHFSGKDGISVKISEQRLIARSPDGNSLVIISCLRKN